MDLPVFNSEQIKAHRPAKNRVREDRPYAWMVESECNSLGELNQVLTLFLTGCECPFQCTMCDLWKNTLDQKTPVGALIEQIQFAFDDLDVDWQDPQSAGISTIKLYNSSNFFDARSVPREDWPAIQELVRQFETVVVENHPAFCGSPVFEFQQGLVGQLEVAVGLETIHPEILPWLNKQMTLAQYQHAVESLVANDIRVRTFILVKPPSLSESEGVHWAVESMKFAFDCGVECCSMVPMRSGNGVMDQLRNSGKFTPPEITSLEQVLAIGLQMKRGRVFMDLWDSEQWLGAACCRQQRLERIAGMNDQQRVLPEVQCDSC